MKNLKLQLPILIILNLKLNKSKKNNHEINFRKDKKHGWSFGESRSKMTLGGVFDKHLEGNPG